MIASLNPSSLRGIVALPAILAGLVATASTENVIGHWALAESAPESLVVFNTAPVVDPEHGVRTVTMVIGQAAPTGSGYLFDGVGNDDFVDLGASYVEQLRETNSLSISAWINPNFYRAGTGAASRHTILAANTHVQFSLQGEGRLVYVYRRAGDFVTVFFSGIPPLPLNAFTHVTVTHAHNPDGWGDDAVTLYVNGEQVAQVFPFPTIDAFEITGNSLFLGRYEGNTARDFDGVISDVGLWAGRALSHQQVAMIGGIGRAGMPLTAGAVNEVLDLFNSGSGTVTMGDWDWTYTTSFADPVDGSELALGKHYYGTDDNIYVLLGGSEGFWQGVMAGGGIPFGTPITIVDQPDDQAVELGETASFSVGVISAGPVEYQWAFRPIGSTDHTDLPGETAAQLVLENISLGNLGFYQCTINLTDGEYIVATREAQLIILDQPPQLIGHWKLDETDPASLLVVNSAPTPTEPGSRTASMQINQSSPVGRGYLFDGNNNDMVTVGNWPQALLNSTNQLTYAGWVKPTLYRDGSGAASRHALFAAGDTSFIIALFNQGRVYARIQLDGQLFETSSPAGEEVVLDEFSHVAVTRGTRDGFESVISIYVNGVLIHEAAGGPLANFNFGSDPLQLGRRGSVTARDYDGVMDDVGLWSAEALPPSTIAVVGAVGRTGLSLSSTELIGHILAIHDAGSGSVVGNGWEWTSTNEFPNPSDGSMLRLGRHYTASDGNVYVVLGGSEGAWTGMVAEAPDLAGYDLWASLHFTPAEAADPEIGGPMATPAGDGVPNLLKYAFDMAPLAPLDREKLPQAAIDGDHLLLTYVRLKDAPDILYVEEISSDLVNWTSDDEFITLVSVEGLGETERVTVRIPPGPGLERVFARLRILLPES